MAPSLPKAAVAVPWPAQTAYLADKSIVGFSGWSPKPTQGPLDHELLKRQIRSEGDNICGYYDGNVESPITCDGTSICVSNVFYGMKGCCRSSTSGCPVFTSCVDQSKSEDCDSECQNNAMNLKCYDDSSSVCNKRIYTHSDTSYSDLFCFYNNSTYNAHISYFDQATTATVDAATNIEESRNEESSIFDGLDTVLEDVTDESGSTITVLRSDDDDSPSTGTVIGGVFGGLALLGIFTLGSIFLFLRYRRQRKRDTGAATASETQETKPELHNECKTECVGSGQRNLHGPMLFSKTSMRGSRFELPNGDEMHFDAFNQSQDGSLPYNPPRTQDGLSELPYADRVDKNRGIRLDTNNTSDGTNHLNYDSSTTIISPSSAAQNPMTEQQSSANALHVSPASPVNGLLGNLGVPIAQTARTSTSSGPETLRGSNSGEDTAVFEAVDQTVQSRDSSTNLTSTSTYSDEGNKIR